jgi:hypothetical protein
MPVEGATRAPIRQRNSTKEGSVNKVTGIKTSRVWLSLGVTALLGLALGCGSVGGAGQCDGVDVSGTCIVISSIVPTDPVGFGDDTPDVDAIQDQCDPGPPAVFEPWGEHGAKLTISATLMPGVTAPPAPAFITLTSYTVDYTASPTNLDPQPPLTSQSFGPTTLALNTDGTVVTFTLEFVNIQTKVEYAPFNGGTPNVQVLPAPTPGNYSAKYTIKGKTQFNDEFTLVGGTTFNISDYDNCSS